MESGPWDVGTKEMGTDKATQKQGTAVRTEHGSGGGGAGKTGQFQERAHGGGGRA